MNNSSASYDKTFSDAIIMSLHFLKGNDILLESSDDGTVSYQSAQIGLQIFDMIKKLKDYFLNQSGKHVSMRFDLQKMLNSIEEESNDNIDLNQVDDAVTDSRKSITMSNIIVSNQTLVVERLTAASAGKSSVDVQDFVDSEEEGASVLSEVAHSDSVETNAKNEQLSDWDVDDNCWTSSDELRQQNTHLNDYTKPVLDDIEKKINVAKIFRKNPSWSMKKLNECSGYEAPQLLRRDVNRWIKDLETGGSDLMRLKLINKWVHAKCREYKDKNAKINDELLQKWGVEGNKILFAQHDHRIPFKASRAWLMNFKRNHCIESKPSDIKFKNSHQRTDNRSLAGRLKKPIQRLNW